jgi:DNA-binding XRE family transcriptional regulator
MTQEALASKISLSRTSVINIEKGRQQLLVHMLVDIARALHVAPSDLIPDVYGVEPVDITSVLQESGVSEKGIDWLKATVGSSRGGS